ncbi:MAG: bifunctional hydroxymethylpyrimidine kinase/phosphomethylpyrimidine kinase [Kiritimatiellae bacterium]|nr:bifunctional hydroxymethylpyrimidine kinase/phosphomethylpyrimidine kinase [Kiritimatiellia bacterium]
MTNCVLTIAGSDSGGNAGIQADLRTCHAYGLHGCTAITALTAQNPREVAAVELASPEFVAAQLEAVLGTYDIRALKTGMFGSAEIVRAVAKVLARFTSIPKVFDPVMVATSGAPLAKEATVRAFVNELMPMATLVTPNLPEADVLRSMGAFSGTVPVLVKGGHAGEDEAIDVLIENGVETKFTAPRIANPVSTHGTGCSLSAAIACELALGRGLKEAIAGAKAYVHDAIATSFPLGEGEGIGVLGFARRKGV